MFSEMSFPVVSVMWIFKGTFVCGCVVMGKECLGKSGRSKSSSRSASASAVARKVNIRGIMVWHLMSRIFVVTQEINRFVQRVIFVRETIGYSRHGNGDGNGQNMYLEHIVAIKAGNIPVVSRI